MFGFLKKALFPTNRVKNHLESNSNSADLDDQSGLVAKSKIHKDLGNAFLAGGKLDAAAECYAKSVGINPADTDAYINLAYVRGEQKRYAEAEMYLKKVVAIDPKNIDAFFMWGTFSRKQSNWIDAKFQLEKALSLGPDFDIAFRCLIALDRPDEAVSLCDQLIKHNANDANAYVNRGHALKSANRVEEALRSFATGVRIQPSHIEANFNESLSRLIIGDFEAGWKQYEWRWQNDQLAGSRRSFSQPLWLGKEVLAGKTILLYGEQGLGDTIQFCRYATKVSNLGARVLMLIPKPLVSLMSSLVDVSEIFTDIQNLPAFDYQCPLMSLPLAFGTTVQTIPGDVPYLFASADLVSQVRDSLKDDGSLRIGLCWKGGNAHPADAERSPGLEPFRNLISSFNQRPVKFYTLLPDSREIFAAIGGMDIGHEIDYNTAPFAETAALIMNLDLVISCDTSIAHVAGALGKAVWLLLPFSSDWRWIHGRSDSDWYPYTQLIRQSVAGDWDDVFERVCTRLETQLDEVTTRQSERQQATDAVEIRSRS